MNRDQIREVFLKNGFAIKDGETDLKPYVYAAAEELLKAAEVERLSAVQGEPVTFCWDAALSLAERTFSTEVGEQLASDITQYAIRLHKLYTSPQPSPDVSALVEALDEAARSLETISRQAGIDEYMSDFLEVRGYARNRALVAFEALSTYHNQDNKQ